MVIVLLMPGLYSPVMNATRTAWMTAGVFLLGLSIGALARGKAFDPSLYHGKPNLEAGKALLELARIQAEDGSWENIAVGRVYYVAGMKSQGQAIFNAATSRKDDAGDWIRMGRAFYDAKDWGKAFVAFDRALQMKPNDAAWLAEVGAYNNVRGNRAKAEALFDRSFQQNPGEVWNTVNMAGSYLGVEPLR